MRWVLFFCRILCIMEEKRQKAIMYEVFRNVNDLLFFAVAWGAIICGIMKMKLKKKDNDK